MRRVCENVFSRPTGLFCRFCWNDNGCKLFPATTTQLFSQSLSSHNLCNCLDFLSTTNELWNFWPSKLQQVSNYACCSWDDMFRSNCTKIQVQFPRNLCNWTESLPTLTSNASIERNLDLFWGNLLETSFSSEIDVGGFSTHQNMKSDTDIYKGYYFIARVFEVNVNTMERISEQRSELHVAKCLIVHVLSSSYNVFRLELWNKR